MRSLGTRRFSGVAGLGLGLALASACSAGNTTGGGSGVHDTGGSSTGATGTGGSGVGNGSGSGNTGNINTGATGGTDPDAGGCQQLEVKFVPKIPTVFVLVDRSGSMFSGAMPPWEPLKTGALQVIQELQDEVAFGWGAFTGHAGVMCPDVVSVAPALMNFPAINGMYKDLGAAPYKSETPVGEALPIAQAALAASPVDGDKYILFVTDGEPDFCDDGDSNCPLDDVVYHLQSLKTQGISTIIFGLQNGNVAPTTLQAFANAGAGQPVAVPFANNQTAQNVFYSCQGVAGWKADATAAGQTGMNVLGTYATGAGGTTKYYQPDPADQDALTTQLRSVLAGVKSCTFDLGGKISVDLTQLDQAGVSIQGQAVPLDMTNGWTMTTDTQLSLVGSACDTWRKPESTKIDFNFPCDILVPVK